jgi:hypothetical protein
MLYCFKIRFTKYELVGHSSVFQLSWSNLLFRQLDGREMCRGVVAGFRSASHGLFRAVAELHAQLTLLQKLKSIHALKVSSAMPEQPDNKKKTDKIVVNFLNISFPIQ